MTKGQDISILQPVRGVLDVYPQTVLEVLLRDNSTGTNIIWADDEYEAYGDGYQATDEITLDRLMGEKVGLIVPRIAKERERQSKRTRNKAEVFTPTWVCKKMIDWADEAWAEGLPVDSNEPEWLVYVESPRLEITCGEAPFLVNRYDASSGEYVEPAARTGILGRKLELVNEHAKDRGEWLDLASRALRSVYGYEFQGDNLLVARINILNSVADYARWAGYGSFDEEEALGFADIISWNLWQMDGLTNCVPYGTGKPEHEQPSLFDDLFANEEESDIRDGRGLARIKNWDTGDEVEFAYIKRKGVDMRFDYIIGNPPYQEETEGNGRQSPIYDKFMTATYEVGEVVELITPARFLFNAGQTPKAWNNQMLSDPHLKVLEYEPDSTRVFPPPTDIKGGVAITLRDSNKDYGKIGVFTAMYEMNGIIKKVFDDVEVNGSIKDIVSQRGLYRLEKSFFQDYPHASESLGAGTGNMLVSNIFEKVPEGFTEIEGSNDIGLIGRLNSKRTVRYIPRKYVIDNDYIDTFNVLVAKSNGTGSFGEALSMPLILEPGRGALDTFMSIGMLSSREEADALLKYIKSKFFRSLLSVKKATQDNPRAVWSLIPIQDFTSDSDIDWSQSVAEIDVQLYKKYGLSDREIEFIETHVKEML